MKPRKSFSAIYFILRALILSGFLVVVFSNKLQAEQEPKSKKSPEQPYAYLFPAKLNKLTEKLQREDIKVYELREDIELDVETYRIKMIVHDRKQAKKRRSFRFRTECRQETKRFQAGTIFVKMNQKLGEKVKELLEPTTEKLRKIRKLFGRLKTGDNYPIVKLNSYVPITHGPVRPLKEKREFNKPITFETIYDPNEKVNFRGSPISGLTWLKDGEHYLHVRDGRLYKVHSESGRSISFFDPNELAKGLKSLPTMDEKTANSLSKRKRFTMNPHRSAVLIDYEND